jgi:nucleotide-binding universal stress UspA family protein
MQRFKNILACVSACGSEQPALARAARLAQENKAQLTVLDVIEEHPSMARAVWKSLHLEHKLGALEREHAATLENRVQPLRARGIPVATQVAKGETFLEIVRTVLCNHHDLVVKMISTEGVFERAFFGSTDLHLLRKCPKPLWLIKPGEPETFRRIAVALDPNMEDAIKFELGFDLLTLGTSLAEMDSAELLVVHAWRPYAEDKLKKHLEPTEFADYVGAWHQESLNRTSKFVAPFRDRIAPSCLRVVQGEPGCVIPHFVKEHAIDLVVMGTLGRLGTQGWFIGDTAERILNRLECSVLAVKPRGFVSPVQAT